MLFYCPAEVFSLLAVGFLFNQNMISQKDKIEAIDYDEELSVIVVRTDRKTNFEEKLQSKIRTSGCAQGTIYGDIVDKFDFKIEIGGGVRNVESIKKYIDAGIEKVILGSAAIKDKNFLKEACDKFPNKIALGLDAKDGYLSVSGWKEISNQLTLDFLKEVNEYGVSRLIYTDINRDGMKQSPNFNETSKVADTSNCPVIISGGVSSIDDIKKARELNNNNIEGIIVGKAIYDGDIKLDELAKELDA